jgi:hypothetical protein
LRNRLRKINPKSKIWRAIRLPELTALQPFNRDYISPLRSAPQWPPRFYRLTLAVTAVSNII